MYFEATQPATAIVSRIFRACFPQDHENMEKVFLAARYLKEDLGPFPGRAIVWKAQVYLHCDGLDGTEPTATTPSGSFRGGAMVFPDLGAKFEYRSGDICIARASALYHAVEEWEPAPCSAENAALRLTPGRVSTVYFCPQKTKNSLEGKMENWVNRTVGGCVANAADIKRSAGRKALTDKKRVARKKERFENKKRKEAQAARAAKED
ncbi:hypothetical protein C8R43DRAFT_885900 [Mycena crocata]|nr:hypothetical protein C8R43DRAFT_885900 [Mycena crocata]